MGLVLNPADLSLDFDASLQVSFFPPTTPTDPCCPPAQGGYLGADNQLVCVTVASFNAGARHIALGMEQRIVSLSRQCGERASVAT